MKDNWQRFLIVLLATGLILGGFGTVYAQEKEKAEFTLEEIIVTAERRETTAQDTPVAITAWSASALDEDSINGNLDLQMRMPSTTFTANKIIIRGVGREMNQIGLDPGVAIYVDGIYNSEQYPIGDTFDVERIEAMRGPQGTLFGKNTVGGAINVVMKRPTPEFEGQVKVRIGTYGWRAFSGVVSGPIYKDKLMGRIIGRHWAYGGDRKNVWNNDYVGGGSNYAGEVRLLYKPTDRFEIYGSWNMGELYYDTGMDRNPDPWKTTGMLYTTATTTVPNTDFNRDPNIVNPGIDNPWHIYRNPADHDKSLTDSNGMAGSTITTFNATDNVTFKHLQEYRQWDWQGTYSWATDPDPNGYQMFNHIPMEVYGWSQELQVIYGSADSPVSFVGGLYYYFMHEYQGYSLPVINLGIASNPVDGTIPASLFVPGVYPVDYIPVIRSGYPSIWNYDVWNETTSKAVYGQVDYQLTDAWNLTLGLRYVEDDKNGWESRDQYYQVSAAQGGPIWDWMNYWYLAPTDPAAWWRPPQTDAWAYRFGMPQIDHYEGFRDIEFTEWIGKVGMDYQPSSDTLIFAKVSKGYKAGGFPLGTTQDDPVDSEVLWAYEAGWKQLWMDARFNTNLSAYYYDYENLQVARDLYNPATGYSISKIENAKGAEIWGIELESKGYVMDNFLVTLTYSYLHSEYLDFLSIDTTFPNNPEADPVTGEIQCEGNPLNRAPEHKFAISGNYTIPSNIGDFSLYVIHYWQDETSYRPFGDDFSIAKPWAKTDARIMWHTPDYKWRVGLDFSNIFNQPGVQDIAVDGVDPLHYRSFAIIGPFGVSIEISHYF